MKRCASCKKYLKNKEEYTIRFEPSNEEIFLCDKCKIEFMEKLIEKISEQSRRLHNG